MKTNEIFKRVREEAGLSQAQLAELCETTQGTISHIELAVNSNPSYDIVSKYIAKVGANPVFLFGIDLNASPIIHPSIQKERLAGGKNETIRDRIVEDLEVLVEKIKSL